mgnify:CR=1 FL=1
MRVIWRFSEKNLFLLWDVRNYAVSYATATAASVLEKVIKTDDDGNKKYDGHLNLYCSGNIIKM